MPATAILGPVVRGTRPVNLASFGSIEYWRQVRTIWVSIWENIKPSAPLLRRDAMDYDLARDGLCKRGAGSSEGPDGRVRPYRSGAGRIPESS